MLAVVCVSDYQYPTVEPPSGGLESPSQLHFVGG